MAIRHPWGVRYGGGDRAASSVAEAEPLSTTNYYEVEDLGAGYQLSFLRVGHVEWEFAARTQFRIKTYLSGALSTELTAAYFTTQTLDDQGDRFTITYTKSGETTTVVVSGVFSETLGELIMEIDSVVLSAAVFGARSVWSYSLEYAVQPAGAEANMCAMLPAFGGVAYRDATTARATEQVGDYPGYLQDTEPLTSNGGQCGFQMSCCWDHAERDCLAFRRIDADGRGARFRYDGDGSNVLMKFEFFPTNNLATQSVTGTAADGITLHPLRGDWYEACTWYRGCLQRENSAHLSRGKIADMSGDVGHISSDLLDVDLIIGIAPGNAFPPTLITNDAAIWSRVVTEVDRVVQYMGENLKYIAHWGTWVNNGANNWQDNYPALSKFITAYNAVAALSYDIFDVMYTFPAIVDPDSTWYTANSASAFTALKSDQTTEIEFASGTMISPQSAIQHGHAAARTALRTHLGLMTGQVTDLDGAYYDTLTGFGPFSDYRDSLTAAQKGPGSSFGESGQKTFLDAVRTEFKVTQDIAQFMMLSEFDDEQKIPYTDSQGVFCLDHLNFNITGLNIYVPAFRTIFSEYVLGFHYGDTFSSLGTLSEATRWDITGWVLERSFHFGQRLGVQWNGFDTIIYLVSQASDTGLGSLHTAIYALYQEPLLALIKQLSASQSTMNVREYHRGRRLHPLPGSVDDLIVRNGYVVSAGAVVPGGAAGTIVDQADVQSSVWESDETGGIGIILTNHHRDSREFFISMPTHLYPEITGGRFLVENVNGTRTLVKSNCHDPALNVVVPPPTSTGGGIRVFELLTSWP